MKPLRTFTVLAALTSTRHSAVQISVHARLFSTTPALSATNRILPSIRNPNAFHSQLTSARSTDTLFLALFTTSGCTVCYKRIIPLLTTVVSTRPSKPADKYSGGIAFAEVELDGVEDLQGMQDLGIEYGINDVPTLVGFGGRRAQRVTERITRESDLVDKAWVEEWVDREMEKGDPFPGSGSGAAGNAEDGGGGGRGWFRRLLGL